MSEVQDIIKDYIAPLEDNYGTTTYNEVVKTLEIKIREAIARGDKFIWQITWMMRKEKVKALYSQGHTQEQMEAECEKIAEHVTKRPVALEKIVLVKEWNA